MLARRILFLSVLLIIALAFIALAAASVRASSAPRVLAFYYAWFDANTWSPSIVSDIPAPTYNSSDPAAIARHIGQAQSAGIDAFVVSWIGPNNPTDWNFKTMLDQAAGRGFSATIDFEVQHFGSRDAVIAGLSYVRDTWMSHLAFFRDGDRPVLFFWREQNYSVADWAAIRQAVDPDHRQVWIAEGVDIAYQQVFDGHHLYSIAWSGNPGRTLSDWSSRVHKAGDKIWVATVMPGYDDTRTTRADRFARPREDGGFYETAWQAAINSNPDWVIITSFNEWVEGSQIEPSVSYGNLYLDLTGKFATQFKSGVRVAAPAVNALAAAPAPTRTPTVTPTPLVLELDERMTIDVLRVRDGPGTDSAILGRLRANRSVRILARTSDSNWLQIAYPDTDHTGWVSAEFVSPKTGLGDFPIIEADPPQEDIVPVPFAPPDYASYDYLYPPWY